MSDSASVSAQQTAAEQLAARIAALREAPAFGHYLRAREQVLGYLDQARAAGAAPSAYWSEELENFDYLLDASPLVIDKLRHHCFHVTGVRQYEYRSGQPQQEARFREKVRALQALGHPELVVAEAPDLGGFGFEIDGALHNLDTTKFSEVLIAMERGGVLQELRRPGDRRLVCEIGAGWGGFGYQVKRLCPDVTYVIVDLPELFLYSGTYLPTVLPGAKVGYWGTDPVLEAWEEFDVVLVPHTALQDFRPERMDLMLNMVSFQEMTTAQVTAYVRHAADVGCPVLYSLNRDRSVYNTELTSVRTIIGQDFEMQEVEVLPMPYNRIEVAPSARDRIGRVLRRGGGEDLEYKHVIGRRTPPAA